MCSPVPGVIKVIGLWYEWTPTVTEKQHSFTDLTPSKSTACLDPTLNLLTTPWTSWPHLEPLDHTLPQVNPFLTTMRWPFLALYAIGSCPVLKSTVFSFPAWNSNLMLEKQQQQCMTRSLRGQGSTRRLVRMWFHLLNLTFPEPLWWRPAC